MRNKAKIDTSITNDDSFRRALELILEVWLFLASLLLLLLQFRGS